MSTRIIEASIAQYATTDLADGKFARFAVTEDTGAVADATIIAARLYISAYRSYSASYMLAVKYDSSSGSTLAKTGELKADSTVHDSTLTLSSLKAALMTGAPDNIYLVVDATSGSGNKINFRELCTITLEIDYVNKCTAPANLTLSSGTSSGDAVTLSWSGGTGGDGNAFKHYEIARQASADGITWGDRETIATTTTKACTVHPPAAFGHLYKYHVRTMGEAGETYASAWVECAATLKKVRPALLAYTDSTITAGATRIKAAHITEIQTNVNRLRQSLGLEAFAFAELRAGYTSLAEWSAHVAELRAAIDEMSAAHEAWEEITENRPTASAMLQLRRVVAAI